TRMYIVLNDEPYDLKPHTLIKLQCKDRHKIIAKHNDIEFIAVKLPILKGDKVTTEK
ncbi:hypothetical protein HOF40_01915, partial [Candidatus Parcubacteria bacterium]|nr:hypothetical protein [Candidatus Parcubacteria bacterium]